jgi:hypothetical protein
MFSLRHEFPTEWHRFLHPATVGAEQILSFTPGRERFPYFARGRDIVPMKVEVFARSTQATTYQLVLSYVDPADPDGALVTSAPLNMPQDPGYGGLNKVTIDSNAAGLNLEELDVSREIRLKLKRSTAADYTGLVTEPEEVEDIFFVVHYKLD